MTDRPDPQPDDDDLFHDIAAALVAEAPAAPHIDVGAIPVQIGAPAIVEWKDEPASRPERSGGFLLSFAAAAVLCILLGGLMVRWADRPSSADTRVTAAQPGPASVPPATPASESDADASDTPAEDADDPLNVEPAPTGSYVVAKLDAGEATGDPGVNEIPVFDEPFGEPRMIGTEAAGTARLFPLRTGRGQIPLVLPLIAGGPDDQFVQVAASTPVTDGTFWVESRHFDFGHTERQVLLTLNGEASRVQVVEGPDLLFDETFASAREPASDRFRSAWVGFSKVVPEADFADFTVVGRRLDRPRSERFADLTLVGTDDDRFEANDAAAVLAPDLVRELVLLAEPGTPVLIHEVADDGTSGAWPAAAVESVTSPSLPTLPFAAGLTRFDPVVRDEFRIWSHCPPDHPRALCWSGGEEPPPAVPIGRVFLIATGGAGDPVSELLNTSGNWPADSRIVPVFDDPDSAAAPETNQRTLIYENEIDGVSIPFPLLHRTASEQPLVLRMIEGQIGDDLVRIQAPIRPTRLATWVSTNGFEFRTTTVSIEIDARQGGGLRVLDRGEVIFETDIVSARASRPHTFHDTYIEQVFEGAELSPAFGNWVATHATFSNAMGTFGAGLPGQSLHGTNQPELVGQAITSGGIRVTDEAMQQIVDAPGGLVGAPIIIFDGSDEANRETIETAAWTPAPTTPGIPQGIALPIPSYS